MRTVVRGRRVVLPEEERAASIHIVDGVIETIEPFEAIRPDEELVEAGDMVVSPGLVDPHVHVNEPGRTEWEGFVTATRAAAAGGVTTLVDMPLNSIPATTNVAALAEKRDAARGRVHVDVAFWGGVVPGNERSLPALAESGVHGFKCFLTPSGVDEFLSVSEADLRAALPTLSALPARLPLLVHAEDPAALREHHGDRRRYAAYLATRPVDAEVRAIRFIRRLAEEYGVRVHFVHVSSGEGIAEVAEAKAAGLEVTAETCPHYLTFVEDDVPDGATAFKCAPPIRTPADRQALWQALASGVCDFVATDHSPSPAAMKCLDTGDFMEAWGGIASLQLSLPIVWTGASARRFTPVHLARWLSAGPSRLCGLTGCKGEIRPGCDADLVLWDPDAAWTVDQALLEHRHPLTPYHGMRLRGLVVATYLRGIPVWTSGRFARVPSGRLL